MMPEKSTLGKQQTYEGLPYIGPMLNLKNEDPDSKKPVINYKAHVKIFDLSKPEELKEYENISDKVLKGFCAVSFEEKQYIPENRNWVVLLRWFDQFYTMEN